MGIYYFNVIQRIPKLFQLEFEDNSSARRSLVIPIRHRPSGISNFNKYEILRLVSFTSETRDSTAQYDKTPIDCLIYAVEDISNCQATLYPD